MVLLVIVLSNINYFSDQIFAWINDRSDYEIDAKYIDIELDKASPIVTIYDLSIIHADASRELKLTSDELKIRPEPASMLGSNWRFVELKMLNPNISGIIFRVGQKEIESQKYTGDLPVGALAGISRIEELSIENGEVDISWELADATVALTGQFDAESERTPDGYSIFGSAKTKLFNESTIDFVLHTETPEEGHVANSNLNLKVSDLDLAWLKFVNIPRVSVDEARSVVNLEANAQWVKNKLDSADWELTATDPELVMQSNGHDIAKVTSSGTWKSEGALEEGGVVDAIVHIESLDGVALIHKFPNSFPKKFFNYMSANLKSFWIPELSITVNGNVLDLLSEPEIQADGNFSNFSFIYNQLLPPIKEAAGTLVVSGVRLESQLLEGTVHGQRLENVESVVENLFVPEPTMVITGNVLLPANEAVKLFGRDGTAMPGKLAMVKQGSGNMIASAVIEVPMRRAREFKIDGNVDLNGVSGVLHNGTQVSNIQGNASFDRYGVTSGSTSAEVYGGHLTANFEGTDVDQQRIVTGTAQGKIDPSQLEPILGPTLPDRFSGLVQFSAKFQVQKGEAQYWINSDLLGMNAVLPLPLVKSLKTPMNMNVRVRNFGQASRTIDLDLDSLLNSSVRMNLVDNKWELERGSVGLGAVKPNMPEAGINMNIAVARLDIDGWKNLFSAQSKNAAGNSNGLNQLNANIGLGILSRQRRIHNISANYVNFGDEWQMDVASDELTGQFEFSSFEEDPKRGAELSINLTKCHIPEASGEMTHEAMDPTTLPILQFSCLDMVYGKHKLGQGSITGVPTPTGWAITNSTFKTDSFVLSAEGNWDTDGNNQRSELDFELTASNLGGAVEELGYGKGVSEGTAKVKGNLSWDDALTNWSPELTSGSISIRADDGYLAMLDNKGVKAIGAFNYGNLLRRLSFDFKDLFEEGFEFERIEGNTKVELGELQFEQITMEGTGADAVIAGTVDWETKQQNLDVVVVPQLSATVPTVVTALVSLPAGILSYLVQKNTSKDEKFLESITATHYNITGTWEDMKVEQVQKNQ